MNTHCRVVLLAVGALLAGCASLRESWSGRAAVAGVVIVGDGRAATDAAVPASGGWADALAPMFKAGVPAWNRTRAQATASQCAAADLPAALRERPQFVVMGFGQGDAESGTSRLRFRDDLRLLVNQCKAAGATPVLVTPPVLRTNDPVSAKPFTNLPPPADADALAAVIRDVGAGEQVAVLDLRAEMQKTYREIGDRACWFLHPPADIAKEVASNVRTNKEWRGPKPRNPQYFSGTGADTLAHWIANLLRAGGSPLKELLRPVEGPPSAGYKLVWNDEFEGASLDTNKWACRYPGKRKDGINDPACMRLDGQGHLVIDIKKVGTNYHSAMLSTDGRRLFRGGYFECRATLAREPGYWSAFWIMGDHVADPERGKGIEDDTLRNGTEIDIMEYLQAQGDVVHLNLHWNGYGDKHKSSPYDVFVPGLRAEPWHVFGCDWRPDGYTFYVDGRRAWETKDAPAQADEAILLSVEIGKWAGDISQARLPQQVMFDWVRVYERPAN